MKLVFNWTLSSLNYLLALFFHDPYIFSIFFLSQLLLFCLICNLQFFYSRNSMRETTKFYFNNVPKVSYSAQIGWLRGSIRVQRTSLMAESCCEFWSIIQSIVIYPNLRPFFFHQLLIKWQTEVFKYLIHIDMRGYTTVFYQNAN